MSYVLHVWEGPQPASPNEVMSLLDALTGQQAEPNPKIAAFARRLTQRYPTDGSGDDVWSAVDGNSRSPVYLLDVLAPSDPVIRVIARTAMQFGLNVHDMQTGRTYFASGRVWPRYGGVERKRIQREELLTHAEFRSEVLEAVHAILAPHGFAPGGSEGRFTRAMPGGVQYFDVATAESEGRFECDFRVGSRFDTIESICERLFQQDGIVQAVTDGTDQVSLEQLTGAPCMAATKATGASRMIGELLRVVVKRALPLLDRRASLHGFADAYLGAAAEPRDLSARRLALRVLVAARLSRHARFGTLALQLAAESKLRDATERAEFARLLKYLQGVDPDAVALPEALQAVS